MTLISSLWIPAFKFQVLLYVFQHLFTFAKNWPLIQLASLFKSMGFFQTFFFSQALKVVLQMMLSHKIAALFALMVITSQGVIGRPAALDKEGGTVGAGLGGLLGGGGGGGLSNILVSGGGLTDILGGAGVSGVSIGAGSGGPLDGAWYVKYGFASDPSLFFYASI